MPYLLRVVRRGRWLPIPEPWFGGDDLQADCFNDLKTDQNTLSFWLIDEQRSNLEAILCAIAAGRDDFAPVDYALLPQPEVERFGKIEPSAGKTPFSAVNDQWHRDLRQLTAARVGGLAHAVKASGTVERIPEKKAEQLIREYTRLGKLQTELMKPKMSDRLRST